MADAGGADPSGEGGFAADGLERRFIAAALCATLTALVLAFAIYHWTNWSQDRRALALQALDLATALAADTRAAAEGDYAAASEIEAMLRARGNAVAASYFHRDGRRFHSGQVEPAVLAPSGGAMPSHTFRTGGVVAHAPHYVGGERVGEVVVFLDDREIMASRVRNIAVAILLSIIGLGAAGVMARRLARRSLAPLRALNEAMEAAAASRDFTARAPIARRDEVGQLARNFNGLMAALESYDASLKGALQEATVARDAAEQASALKSHFLANMSHELRTPLNGVLGMAQVLMLDDLTTLQRERVGLIVSSGQALLTVLSDILDLADIESGHLTLADARFDLESLVHDAVSAAQAVQGARRLALSIELAPEACGAWMGDAARVRQVLFHLIANAIKFTEAGSVRISAAGGATGALVLSVTDTGQGIAAERLSQLFESFVQGDGGATRRAGGAGVGLTICRKLVDLMGGELTVESAEGRGSTFTVSLPLRRARQAA